MSTLEVASAFYLGGSIESRVRRLVEPAEQPARSVARRSAACSACSVPPSVAGLIALAAPAIHQFMEVAVQVLP